MWEGTFCFIVIYGEYVKSVNLTQVTRLSDFCGSRQNERLRTQTCCKLPDWNWKL